MSEAQPGSGPAGARCPRCGYDQRGIMATWTEACPLEGTCAECGLTFNWAEVLQPERFEPRWCVEYAPLRRAVPHAAFGTYLRSYWPWRFWSRLQMSHRIRWRRLAAYVMLLLALLAGAYVLEQGAVAWRVRHEVAMEIQRERAYVAGHLQNMLQMQQSEEWETMPIADRLSYVQRYQALLARQNATTYAVNHSYAAAITEAVLRSPGRTSKGTISGMGGVMPYHPPRVLHSCVVGGLVSGRSGELIAMIAVFTLWMTPPFFLLPLGFVCLPVSRRRAKVRWRHVARVTAYGLFIPVTTASLTGMGIVFDCAIQPARPTTLTIGLILTCAVAPLATVAWWAVAIKRYLRLPHGWAVALLLGVMAALLAMVLVAIIDGAYS